MNAYFLSLLEDTPTSGYWDYAILDELLDGFQKKEVRTLEKTERAIVIIPARSHANLIDHINAEIQKIDHVVLFLMGDEEHLFPVEQIFHPSVHIWVQNPKPIRHDAYNRLGCGFTPHVRTYAGDVPEKDINWFFAGQITHERRILMAKILRKNSDGILIETEGFTQGYPQEEYCQKLSKSKIVPCPSGPETPDTFRVYEALEFGCVPIADEATRKEEILGFWNWMFNEQVPFPTYIDPLMMFKHVNITKSVYPIMNNLIQAWWYRWKQKTKAQIKLQAGFSPRNKNDLITVVIPISPISSHPDTKILEETIQTLRFHLPESEVVLTFDGVRKEHQHLHEAYQEHIRRILWKCREWKNVSPYIFNEHTHQVGMARTILPQITTPLLLYVEQDTPLVIDEPIDWDALIDATLSQKANVIRLHFEGVIPEAHTHLMIGKPENDLLKTVQWSQRPHLARVDFYRQMLEKHFTPDAKCFIEDKIHGCLQDDWGLHGEKGWENWKLFIYHPMTGNIKRSYHTDGRAGAQKLDETQIW